MIKSLEIALRLLIKHGVWKEDGIEYLSRLLVYCHDKNYLWFGKENGRIKAVAIAYRIKTGDDSGKIPEKNEGDILYVPMLVSEGDKSLPLKMLRSAIQFNHGVKKIQYKRQVKNEFERTGVTPST